MLNVSKRISSWNQYPKIWPDEPFHFLIFCKIVQPSKDDQKEIQICTWFSSVEVNTQIGNTKLILFSVWFTYSVKDTILLY
jgi:hypothetical protein